MTKLIAALFVTIISLSCNSSTYKQGERIYQDLCSNCHMPDGKGLNKLIPSLNGISKYNYQEQVCLITKGVNADSLGMAMIVMPAFKNLKPAELTNLINFINQKWNADFNEVTMPSIERFISNCLEKK